MKNLLTKAIDETRTRFHDASIARNHTPEEIEQGYYIADDGFPSPTTISENQLIVEVIEDLGNPHNYNDLVDALLELRPTNPEVFDFGLKVLSNRVDEICYNRYE